MKNNALKSLLAFFAVISLSLATSCGNREGDSTGNDAQTNGDNNMATNSTVGMDTANADHDMAEDHNDAKFKGDAEDDAQFVVDAAVMNMKEIDAGNMAMKRGMAADVKDLAKHMVTDHTKALNDLKALAGKKNITVPTALADDDMKKSKDLADEKGSDFDGEYADMMVDEHQKAIDRFERASKNAKDPDVKAWADKMLPDLRHHLDMSMAVRDRIKK